MFYAEGAVPPGTLFAATYELMPWQAWQGARFAMAMASGRTQLPADVISGSQDELERGLLTLNIPFYEN